MKQIKSSFFCYALLISPFLLSACTTTQQTVDPKYSTAAEKRKITHKNKEIPPALIQVVQSPERLRIILYSDGCFQANGRLTAECSQQLTATMKTIKHYGDGLVQVVGYTDDIYDPKMAAEVSQQQADSVMAFLWSKGIASQRLRAIGFGNHDSIASHRNVKASAANRRVEIMLVK
jgi:outer membrane protein OmpA-like peptidoglycan-associated protein